MVAKAPRSEATVIEDEKTKEKRSDWVKKFLYVGSSIVYIPKAKKVMDLKPESNLETKLKFEANVSRTMNFILYRMMWYNPMSHIT